MVQDKKPIRTPLIIRSDDMEPKRYECLSDAANDIKVSKQTLIYEYENKRPLITRRLKFSILNGSDYNTYLTEISIITSEHNQEATLYPQELTSTLLSPMTFQVHLLGSKSPDCQGLPQFLSICKSS